MHVYFRYSYLALILSHKTRSQQSGFPSVCDIPYDSVVYLEEATLTPNSAQTNDGDKVTLKKLLDESKSGVVLFTYPKASTPGCRRSTTL